MPVNCAPREGSALRLRGVAQSGSAPALGAGCRGFESLHPDHLLPVMPQRRGVAFGSVRQVLCLRFLMVAVAHQVEHRIVAPEVAGSRPVSHPIILFYSLTAASNAAQPCAGVQRRLCARGCQCVLAGGKKKGQSMPRYGVLQAWVLRPSVATRNSPVVLTCAYNVAL